ncbi:MAG: (2Fe-2S) ferredoxin domain-containing protein [Spirochaetota bacterium]
MKETVISICMGSSCFARGNNRNIEIIRAYIEKTGSPVKLTSLKGNLCQGACAKGPNIAINGQLFSGVFPENVGDIIRLYCGDRGDPQ